MMKLLLLTSILLIFSACDAKKPAKKLDGKRLTEQKCASCHNLSMPPVISDDELAPPMMAVAFHMPNFMEPKDESQRIPMAIEFVVDYVRNPSLEKSKCDKESIKRYGLMASQKDNVTEDEVKAIAEYMFKHYTQQNLSKIQEDIALFNALAPGEKIALKHKCLGCHKVNKKIVGPSFVDISEKYKDSKEKMIQAIKNGSRNSWESSKGAVMPPFKQISEDELDVLSDWILKGDS